jgi:hypothetical protein
MSVRLPTCKKPLKPNIINHHQNIHEKIYEARKEITFYEKTEALGEKYGIEAIRHSCSTAAFLFLVSKSA